MIRTVTSLAVLIVSIAGQSLHVHPHSHSDHQHAIGSHSCSEPSGISYGRSCSSPAACPWGHGGETDAFADTRHKEHPTAPSERHDHDCGICLVLAQSAPVVTVDGFMPVVECLAFLSSSDEFGVSAEQNINGARGPPTA